MADLEKSVAIIFEGVDQMGAGVDSATRQMDGLGKTVQKVTAPMSDLTKNILAFEAAMLTAGVAATAFAIKLAGDFDAQFREISTLIDEPTESLGGFREEILAYTSQSTQSLDTVSSALYNAISAGVDYSDSLDVVAQAEKMAVAGKADLDQSLGVLVSSLNAYGKGMDEAEHFSDLLFTTVKNGVTTLPELGNSLASVTGLAATAGVSFEELLAAVATLTATGTGTSEAMTQIRAAIGNIIKPTEQAKDLASELGVEFSAAALESRGFAGILEDVQKATGGNTEQMAQLFGSIQALNGVLTLTGLGAESFAGNVIAMGDATGATEEAYERMAGTVEQGAQRIKNAMMVALVAVGDPLLESFGGIQEAIAAIFNAIGASVSGGQLSSFVDEIQGMMQGIEQALLNVAQNLPGVLEQEGIFDSFFNGIELVKTAIADLFEGANLTSAEGLTSVIQTLGLAFETLSAYTAGAITALGPFLEQMARLAQFVLELNPELVKWVGYIGGLAVAFNTLGGVLRNTSALLSALAGSGGIIAKGTPIVAGLVGVLTGPVGLALAVGAVGAAAISAGRDILGFNDSVDPAIQAIMDQNKAIEEGLLVWDYAINDWAKAGDAQEDLAAQTQRMSRELQDAFNGIRGGTNELAEHERAVQIVNSRYGDFESQVEKAMLASEGFDSQLEKNQSLVETFFQEQLAGIGNVEQGWKDLGNGVFVATSNMGDLLDAQREINEAFEKGIIDEDQYKRLTENLEEMKKGTYDAAASQKELAAETLDTEEAILKARQAILDYEVALEQIASNERIRSLELAVDLQTAQLEADVRTTEAIFESLNTTIESTGETLGALWGILGSGDLSRFQEIGLEREIARESARRDEALKVQNERIRAEIEMMKVRTEALRSGDGLINISSDGLEPALEMIMWQIIEKVQLRANAEGAEFLLGI